MDAALNKLHKEKTKPESSVRTRRVSRILPKEAPEKSGRRGSHLSLRKEFSGGSNSMRKESSMKNEMSAKRLATAFAQEESRSDYKTTASPMKSNSKRIRET